MTADEITAKIAELTQQAQAINQQLINQSPDMQAILGQIKGLEMVQGSPNGEVPTDAPDPDTVEVPQG